MLTLNNNNMYLILISSCFWGVHTNVPNKYCVHTTHTVYNILNCYLKLIPCVIVFDFICTVLPELLFKVINSVIHILSLGTFH